MTSKRVDNGVTTDDMVTRIQEGLGTRLFRHFKDHRSKIAQIDGQTGRKDTYGDLLQRCTRTALVLSEITTSDDVICICSDNHLDAVVPYVASLFANRVVWNLSPIQQRHEITHLLNAVRPKVIIAVQRSKDLLSQVLTELDLIDSTDLVTFGQRFDDKFLRESKDGDDFEPVSVDPESTCAMFCTSGSSGYPKVVCHTHASVLTQFESFMAVDNFDLEGHRERAKHIRGPVTALQLTEPYWISYLALLLGTATLGFTRLLCSQPSPGKLWDLISHYRPCMLAIVPSLALELLHSFQPSHVADSITNVNVIGAAISADTVARLHKIFVNADIYQGYGFTEACGVICRFNPCEKLHRPLMAQKPQSVGLPIRGVSIKVVDPDSGLVLGPNQPGEIRVKAPFLMAGYLAHSCVDSFDGNWYKTGDIGYYDSDLCFYITDRIKEVFKYRGWFVSAAVLENELLQYPGVKQAVVVGVPGEFGEHATALVVLAGESLEGVGSRELEEDIEMFVEERVSDLQRLRGGVRVVRSLPMTATGKVNRRVVRDVVMKDKISLYL